MDKGGCLSNLVTYMTGPSTCAAPCRNYCIYDPFAGAIVGVERRPELAFVKAHSDI
jgi:hypothetical protein